MTKKEIKGKSTEDLLCWLFWLAASTRASKKTVETAKRVCRELQERGVIEEPDKLTKALEIN